MSRLALVVVFVTACAARPKSEALPVQRASALQMFMAGATTRDVASKLGMRHADARTLIRTAIVDLNRQYYRGR
jgi:hypothetical protein